MKRLNFSPVFTGFLQALGVFIYCILVAIFFHSVESWLGKLRGPFIAILLLLLLFCISVLICALLVGAYPVYIYFINSKENLKKALKITIWSGGWLLIFFFGFLGILWYS